MAGQRLRAAVVIDLTGNLARRARQFSGDLTAMSRSGQGAMRALRQEVVRASGAIDRMGGLSSRAFSALSAGVLGVAGLGYTANRLFISAAAQREQQIIAMNSLYHGDKARAQSMMDWAKQNAKETTWGLGGVLDEIRSSKGFGMTDDQTKDFITMLQDQGAMHGWDLPTAQGASLQLKQMFARQQITAADANLLTGYGINVYQALADATGEDVKKIRELGTKGKLGLKSILTVFAELRKQSAGAQKSAMNSWDGMTAQMEANWTEFAVKVANSGPFDALKARLKTALKWHDDAVASGELDRLAETVGGRVAGAFTEAEQAAVQLWDALKPGRDALSWVNQNVVSLKKLAAALVAVWLANKALRLGAAVARPGWRMATAPLRWGGSAWRWWRNRRRRPGTGVAELPDALNGGLLRDMAVQRVFVTNWPSGWSAGGTGGAGGGRRTPRRTPRGRAAPRLSRLPFLRAEVLPRLPAPTVPRLPVPVTTRPLLPPPAGVARPPAVTVRPALPALPPPAVNVRPALPALPSPAVNVRPALPALPPPAVNVRPALPALPPPAVNVRPAVTAPPSPVPVVRPAVTVPPPPVPVVRSAVTVPPSPAPVVRPALSVPPSPAPVSVMPAVTTTAPPVSVLPAPVTLTQAPVVRAPAPPRTVPAVAGTLTSRLAGSAVGQGLGRITASLTQAGRAVSSMVTGAGNRLAQSAVGRVVSQGAGVLGWLGKGAGRAASRLGGPALAAATLAPVLLDEQTTTREKSSAVGGTVGSVIGGAVGSLAGPLGTVAGATLGSVAGEYLGGFVSDLYDKWTAPDRPATPPPEQKVNAQASLRVELADGLRLTSTRVTEDGMDLNVFAGGNYLTGF